MESVVRRYYEQLWNEWRFDDVADLLAPEVRFRGSLGVEVAGHEGFVRYMRQVREAFPDFHNRIDELVVSGDRAAVRLTYRGTHRGALFDIPPTGMPVTYSGAAFFQFRDGRIVDGWVLGDLVGLRRQLGVVDDVPPSAFATLAAHAGSAHDEGSVAMPIYQTSTFRIDSAAAGAEMSAQAAPPRFYTRWGNPTTAALEGAMAALEGGEAALAFASGMAAASAAVLATVKSGDHIVAGTCLYGAMTELLERALTPLGVETTFVDTGGPEGPDRIAAALRPNTRLLYMETPANPTLAITDLAAAQALARPRGITTLVDNTWATPCNQRPLELGIDAVVHSATKYLGGHSDVIAGIIVGRRAFLDRVWEQRKIFGGSLSPHDAFLVLRGIKTLAVRVPRQNASALALARYLSQHPSVKKVYHPGLPDHPGHAIARRQMRGTGGMVSFEVAGGLEAGHRFVESLRLITHAVSVGGTESLVVHPASTTHAALTPDERQRARIADGLVRMSVGLESAVDLAADIAQALEAVHPCGSSATR
jgi:methionine-gamma-lyase